MDMRMVDVPLAVNSHLLQHTLRSLCGELQYSTATASAPNSWVYSIFWRILPRNYPPPIWDNEAGPFDRTKGNKRNWILVWEDGYCDFVACSREEAQESKKESRKEEGKEEGQERKAYNGPLQPELFFKMSHDVYNYGEGLMGKVAAEKSHKWIFRDPTDDENVPLLSAWQASAESYPRTWEAQFKAGIQTIAIIAVGEGLLQLGSTKKVSKDVDFMLMLQRKFGYLQSIPGVFAQTKIARAMKAEEDKMASANLRMKQFSGFKRSAHRDTSEDDEACSSYPMVPLNFPALPNSAVDVPSMYNSLQVLLSKLPAVTPNAAIVDATKAQVGAAINAAPQAAGASSSMVRPPTACMTYGNSLLTGSLATGSPCSPLTTDVWPNLRRPQPPLPLPPATLSSTNQALPHLSDELEAYHSLFGQLIS